MSTRLVPGRDPEASGFSRRWFTGSEARGRCAANRRAVMSNRTASWRQWHEPAS